MNNPSTCGTCRFWGDRFGVAQETYKICTAIPHDARGYSTGSYPVLEDDPEEVAEERSILNRPAVVKDGSGYYAALRCREDFGCVMHEVAGGDEEGPNNLGSPTT